MSIDNREDRLERRIAEFSGGAPEHRRLRLMDPRATARRKGVDLPPELRPQKIEPRWYQTNVSLSQRPTTGAGRLVREHVTNVSWRANQ
jgi:hypothetical protein